MKGVNMDALVNDRDLETITEDDINQLDSYPLR